MSTTGVFHGRPSSFHLPKPPAIDDDIVVAELLQGLRGEGTAHTAGAVHDDLGVLVEQPDLDLRLEVTARDVNGVGQRALVVFVGLTNIEHDCARGDLVGSRAGVDLADLGLRGVRADLGR